MSVRGCLPAYFGLQVAQVSVCGHLLMTVIETSAFLFGSAVHDDVNVFWTFVVVECIGSKGGG